jgi:hypothetical protein
MAMKWKTPVIIEIAAGLEINALRLRRSQISFDPLTLAGPASLRDAGEARRLHQFVDAPS